MHNPDPKRVLGYARVSTEEQSRSGASLPAQRQAIEDECQRRGWRLLEVVEDVASGKSLKRSGIQSALAQLKAGEADALVCCKLDRLSRRVTDFGKVLEDSANQGWALRLLDLDIDTTTSMGEAMAFMVSTFAQAERKRIGERTREGMAERRKQGVKFGRPKVLPVNIVKRIVREREAGAALAAIADRLNTDQVPTAHGGRKWWPETVSGVLRSAAIAGA